MEEKKEKKLTSLIDHVKDYVTLKVKILSLSLVDRTASFLGNLIASSVVFIFVAVSFFFGSIALAILLGEIVNSYALGFFIVALIYLFLGFILAISARRLIERMFANLFIKNILKNDYSDDKDTL